MKRKYYSLNGTKEIYYTGKDQKNSDNLINLRSGSEYFLPRHVDYDAIESRFVELQKETALSIVPDAYGNHS